MGFVAMNVEEATRLARSRAGLNLTGRLIGQIDAADAEERITRDPSQRPLILDARSRAKVDALQHLAAYRSLAAAMGLYRVVEPLRVQLALQTAPSAPAPPVLDLVMQPVGNADFDAVLDLVTAELSSVQGDTPWSIADIAAELAGAQ